MLENFKFQIFVKYFFVLSCFLLVPFACLSMFLSEYVMSEYKNEIYDMAYNSVVYIRDMVDEKVDEKNQVEALVKADSDIKNFMTMSATNVRGDKIYKAYNVSCALEEYTAYRDIIESVHLYSELQDVVLAQKVLYTREEYFGQFLRDSGMEYKEWCDAIDQNAAELISVICSNGQSKTLAMINVLQHGGEQDGALIEVLNMNRIKDIYMQVVGEMPDMYFAVTSGKEVLIESGKLPDGLDMQAVIDCDNQETLHEDSVLFRSASAKLKLEYLCIVSENVILENFTKIQLLLYVMILFMAIGMLILVFLFSNVTFGPVKEMMMVYQVENKYKVGGLNELQDLFINVYNSNINLREILKEQEECINNNMFRLLVQNSMELDSHALQILFRAMPLSSDFTYFCVVTIRLEKLWEYTEESLDFRILTELHYQIEREGAECCVIPNEQNKIIFLFACNRPDVDFRLLLEITGENLREKEGIEVTFAKGCMINSLHDFSKSYEDAIFALNDKRDGVKVYDGSSVPLAEKVDLINREELVSYILAGNNEKLTFFFNSLYVLLFDGYAMTYRIHNYIRYSLFEVLSEALSARKGHSLKLASLEEQCRSALELSKYEDSYKIIRLCFFEAAEEISKQTVGKKKRIEDVLRYIDENYAQYDISLKTVAEEMELSYKYVSDAFKKETGKNFLEYLHEIRSRKAKELLASTEIPIAEIGEKIGYLSSNTFIKTFKKINGMTPGEYRNNLNESAVSQENGKWDISEMNERLQ